jgi:PAS domain S-box-containing protein
MSFWLVLRRAGGRFGAFLTRLRGPLPAAIAMASALALHYALGALFGMTFAGIFFVYLCAILIASWSGFLEGYAGVLFVVYGIRLFIPSKTPPNVAGLVVLLLVSTLVSTAARARRRMERRLLEANQELDRRVQEKTAALHEANEELTRRFAELQAIYDQVPVGLCLFDDNLRYVKVNESLAKLNGRAPAEHLGRTVREMLPGPLAERLEPFYRNALKSAEPTRFELDSPIPGPNTDIRNWLIICAPVRANGKNLGLQAIVQDVTETRRTQAELEQANSYLKRLNTDLEQFAYSAAHDLKEPVRTVSLFTELLATEYRHALQDPRAQEYLHYTQHAARKLDRLISDLRAYLSADYGAAPENVVTREVVVSVLETLNLALRTANAKVSFEALPDVRMARVHLELVLQNLISNAIKYRNSEPPHIHISGRLEKSDCCISVRDNGIGIDRKYHELVFGLFKRLHAGDSQDGTGLGLAICKRIVDGYGGRIWVESEPGRGSTFHFTVPASKQPAAQTADLAH